MAKKILAIWMFLPLIPIGLTIYYLNRYSGITGQLRLLLSLLLGFSTLFLMFLGWWSIRAGKRRLSRVLGVLSGVFLVGSAYFTYVNMRVYWTLNQMIVNQQTQNYSLVVMAGEGLLQTGDLNGGRIGVIPLTEEISTLVYGFLADAGLLGTHEIIPYESPISMVQDLYDGKLDAVIIGSGFQALLESREGFENIASDTLVLEDITVTVEETLASGNSLMGSPFSLLLIGKDSLDDFDGLADTLILTTINPENLSVTLTTIPRDTFAHIPAIGYSRDKINHASNFGVQAVVDAVEGLFGMDISYHVTVNFAAVVELVDTLGGIEVDVPISFTEQNSRRQFGSHLIEVEAGRQILNGEQALALARHRHSLANQDLGRAAHQQLVIEAILRQVLGNTRNINEFLALFAVLGNNIETNLSVGQMSSVMQFLMDRAADFQSPNPMDYIHMMNTVLTGVSAPGMTPWYWFPLDVFYPYNGALADSYRFMSINLGNEEPPRLRSFHFNGLVPLEPTRWLQKNYEEDPRWSGIAVPGVREPEYTEDEENLYWQP
ncbi:MAG: LCP family protein [Turicibacter sp.]|nr:LCP family protein [Turicibacter sp.]